MIYVRLTSFFAGRRCYSEHGASASRVRAPAEGRRTAAVICPFGDGRAGEAECLKEAELACFSLELEAKERAARAEAERDAAHHEAVMAKFHIEGVVNT